MKQAIATLVGAMLTIAGAASAQDLRIGLQDDPDTLDPAKNFSFVGRHVLSPLCDKLVDIAPDQSLVPQLALAWETSPDGRSATMRLRPGVKFHDGEPFNAAAVKFNIERMLNLPDSRRKSEISVVTGAEAIDELTVRINLASPFAPLFAQFADRAGMMVSPKAAETAGDQLGSHPVCAGPYKFVRRVIQDRIVLEKFDDYWNKDAYHFKTITFTGMPDATVRLANLRAGQNDLIERLAASDIPAVKGDARLGLASVTSLAYQGITFNIANSDKANPAFARNAKLRQALELAIDRQSLVDVVFAGVYVPGNQAFPPGNRFYNADLPVPKRDLARARALVAESGVAAPSLTLLVPNDTERQQVGQVIQSMAKDAGIDIKLQAIEFISMLSQQRQGNFEATLVGWSGRVDPDGNLHQLLTCTAPTNDAKYCNPELDRVLNEARGKSDLALRKTLYDKAAAILAQDRPVIYLFHNPWIFAFSAKMEGFVPYPDGIIRLAGVRFKQ